MATLEAIRERVLRARAHAAVRHEDEIVRELDEALAEIERLQDDVGIRELRASSRLHAQLDTEPRSTCPLNERRNAHLGGFPTRHAALEKSRC